MKDNRDSLAAVYARISHDQKDKAEDAKSIPLQIKKSEACAIERGLTVVEGYVWSDEESGAEFEKRPGLQALLSTLKPEPPFRYLIVRNKDRLGREQFESNYILKRLDEAGVRVVEYLKNRECPLDTPIEKFTSSAETFAAEQERHEASKRTKEKLEEKAKQGFVTGGRVYGYVNTPVFEGGKRSHVERTIHEAQAEVVRRIFRLCEQGFGLRRIAHMLNAEGVPSPHSTPEKPGRGWVASSVRTLLHQDLYRGELVWNRTAKRTKWGKRNPQHRPQDDWIRCSVPHLQIVPRDLWDAAHERLRSSRESYLRSADGRLWGKPGNGIESKHLLTGLALCAPCGGALVARHRKAQSVYQCTTYLQQGPTMCAPMALPMRATDEAVLAAIEAQVFRPEVIRAAVEEAIQRLRPSEDREREQERLRTDLARLNKELTHLTAAIAAGDAPQALVTAIREREGQRTQVSQALAALDITDLDLTRLERDLRAALTDWRVLLLKHVQSGRQILRKLLDGRLRFTPNGKDGYLFEGVGRLDPLLGAVKASVTPAGPD